MTNSQIAIFKLIYTSIVSSNNLANFQHSENLPHRDLQ